MPAASPPPLFKLLPPDIQKSKSLVMATDAAYPPCEYFPAPGKPMVGFEPDLWNAMARKLGIKIKPVNTNFNGLIPGVQSGRYPAAMECISDSAAREKQVTFIDAFFGVVAVYTTAKHAAQVTSNPFSLCGLTVALQTGTDFAGMVKDTLSPHCTKIGKPAIKTLQFPAQSAVLLALYSGRADFIISDLAAAAYLKKKAPQPVVLRTNRLLPKLYLGIVVNKNNVKLQQAFLAAMKAIQADGEYDKIMAKWGVSQTAFHHPGINLATKKPLPTPKP